MGREVETDRETVKQKCRELVYQRFPPVVSSAGTDSSDGDYRGEDDRWNVK
jgi:hypothetical protein